MQIFQSFKHGLQGVKYSNPNTIKFRISTFNYKFADIAEPYNINNNSDAAAEEDVFSPVRNGTYKITKHTMVCL
jgi:hypothetical protein